MGWSIGGPDDRGRFVGYGVPAYCDDAWCDAKIDRGLAHVCCDEQPFGEPDGCGLYFCEKHHDHDGKCRRCQKGQEPWTPKPEHPEWMQHLLSDESWAGWRAENPETVAAFREALAAAPPKSAVESPS